MDGVVTLTLEAVSTSAVNIVDLDGLNPGGSGLRTAGGKTNFVVETGAAWTGIIKGINDASAGDGASFVNNGGAPITGTVGGGSNSVITFNNGRSEATTTELQPLMSQSYAVSCLTKQNNTTHHKN